MGAVFKYCCFKLIEVSTKRATVQLRPKSFSWPPLSPPAPSMTSIKQALLKSTLGIFAIPQVDGSQLWSHSVSWCGWCPGIIVTPSVGARHTAQTHAGGLGHEAPSQPAQRQAGRGRAGGCAQCEQRIDLAGPPPPTWTWKCRLTVRMGRVA